MPPTGGRASAKLRERLEARREEIEAAAQTRVRAIADPAEVADPAYAEGLRSAVAAAVGYGIETTGRESPGPPIPVVLFAQARLAARAGIPLDTVLRRYFAGYSLLGYFILDEAANAGIADGDELQRLLGVHAGIFDRLLTAVGEEHGREGKALASLRGQRRLERIERLLAGEQIDTMEIPYDFGGWHLGVVATGPDAERTIREGVATIDCNLLLLDRGGAVWAWLGTGQRLDPADVLRALASGEGLPREDCGERVGDDAHAPRALAIGEPAKSLAGWRVTHRQAAAAWTVAARDGGSAVRYTDVALLAAVLCDDLLSESLRSLILVPLESGRAGGKVLRDTLRAYVEADRSLTSAAGTLEVSPRTIANRLRRIEEILGRPLHRISCELEIAIRLHQLES